VDNIALRNLQFLVITENCKLRRAISSAFYNILQRNFGILLILWCSFKLRWNFCLDQNFSYKVKGPLTLDPNIITRLCSLLHTEHTSLYFRKGCTALVYFVYWWTIRLKNTEVMHQPNTDTGEQILSYGTSEIILIL
jgi:hypothetical protein